MYESTTLSKIGALLGPAIVIAIFYGYIPPELGPVRMLLSTVQLICIVGVAVITLRSLWREF